MNTVTELSIDPQLIHELRSMVRAGANVQAMADLVCMDLNTPANSFVPVFAYFKRAFWVPLKFLLPLQAGFDAPYAQVALVGFRFSAEILGRLDDVTPWALERFRERLPHFDPSDLQYRVNETENRQIAFCVTRSVPTALYCRGFIQEGVDKSKAWDRKGERDRRIHDFAADFANAIRQTCESLNLSKISPTSLNLEFQIEEIGPMYKIVCLVQTLVDVSVEEAVLASV